MGTTGTGAGQARSAERGELPSSALAFARRVHLGQHRKQDDAQYVEHPIAVAGIVRAEAGNKGTLIAAAYLHDVVEKTPVSTPEIAERFGPEIGEIVGALSEDPGLAGYAERKRELRARALGSGDGAALIYAADRIANVRDWLGVDPTAREDVAERLGTSLEERLALWDEDLAAISATLDGLSFLAELELGLRELRAATSA